MAERRKLKRLLNKPDRMAICDESSESDEEHPPKRNNRVPIVEADEVPDCHQHMNNPINEEGTIAEADEVVDSNEHVNDQINEDGHGAFVEGNFTHLENNADEGLQHAERFANPVSPDADAEKEDAGTNDALEAESNENQDEVEQDEDVEEDKVEEDEVEDDEVEDDEVEEDEEEEEDEEDEEEEDEEEEEEEDEENRGDGNKPLYNGAPVSVNETLLALMTLVLTHSITGVCLGDFLKFIALILPPQNLFRGTLYRFKKYFADIGNHILTLHYFCSGCFYPLETKASICEFCHGASSVSYFIELPIIIQIQRMLMRVGFFEKLQFRFQRVKKQNNNIEDIYDGSVYKKFFQPGKFLHNHRNISFMWYTDGVAIFRGSANFSIWPLYLVINELNYKNRVKRQNMILAGLWFGGKKPDPNLFLLPFQKFFESFSSVGYEFSLPNGNKINMKGMLLCGTCDYPAKTSFMRFAAHNGYYGCVRCFSPGTGVETPGGLYQKGRVQVYPYERNIRLRNHAVTKICADTADRRGKTYMGVHGSSILYGMMPDFIRCMGQDIMHGTYIGVFKLLMYFWFSPECSQNPYSLRTVVRLVDARLSKIRPPSFVQRVPRTIEKYLKHWKASEYKNFMMFYSVPVLQGILDEVYFQNFLKLVSAIYLLGQDSISLLDIERARRLLHSFVSEFQELYGVRYLSINVHQLLHLPDIVLELGPTWVYSCFFLEGMNAYLLKMFHGTRHVGLQICSSASNFISLPVMVRDLRESSLKQFCEQLLSDVKNLKILEQIPPLGTHTFSVGKYVKIRIVPPVIRQAMALANLPGCGNWLQFDKLRRKGILYCAQTYTRMKSRNSSLALLSIGNASTYCRIDYFVKRTECNCLVVCECPGSFYGIGTLFRPKYYPTVHDVDDVRLPYILSADCLNEKIAFPVQSITCLCFNYRIDNEEFILKPLNSLEVE